MWKWFLQTHFYSVCNQIFPVCNQILPLILNRIYQNNNHHLSYDIIPNHLLHSLFLCLQLAYSVQLLACFLLAEIVTTIARHALSESIKKSEQIGRYFTKLLFHTTSAKRVEVIQLELQCNKPPSKQWCNQGIKNFSLTAGQVAHLKVTCPLYSGVDPI